MRIIYSIIIFQIFIFSGFQALSQTTYTWNQTSGGAWITSTNWTPTRSSPATNDILVVNGGQTQTITDVPAQTIGTLTISGSSTVTLTAASAITLTIGNGTGTDLTVAGSSSLTIGSNLNITLASSATADISGTLIVNSGRTYNTDGTSVVTTVSGTLQNIGTVTSATASKLAFTSTSTYDHAQNSGVIPTSTWNTGSTCKITGTTTATAFSDPGGNAQAFSNLVWDCPSQTGIFSLCAYISMGSSMSITGTLTVNRTGSGALATGVSYQPALTVGNFLQTGGSVYINNNSSALRTLNVTGNFTLNQATTSSTFSICTGSGQGILNVGGNFTMSAGTLNKTAGTANLNFNGSATQTYSKTGGTISQAIDFTINSGAIVDFGTSIIDGSTGTFTLTSGGSIITANTSGISTTASTGSIQVSGTKTYNTGTSFTYNGSSAQVTGNGLPATINNLTINNTAGVSLSANVTVNSTLTFTNGLLTTNSFKVTLGTSANISGEATGKYVAGNFEAARSVGTSSASFGGMGVTIASGSDDLGTVTILRKSGSGTAASFNSHSSINRIWDITITGTQPSSGRSVTFTWVSDDDNSKDLTQMQIWRRETPSSHWVEMSSLSNVSSTRSITVNTTHFSEWTASDGVSLLPVSMISFTGNYNMHKQVELFWITATEHNNKGFDIEKSQDGINFSPIGFIEGKGNSNKKSQYNFIDKETHQASYYRLKQQDWDDNFKYSAVIYISPSTQGFLMAHPELASDKVIITGDEKLAENQNLIMEVFSDHGFKLLSYQGFLEDANKILDQKFRSLSSGMYIIRLNASKQSYVWKVYRN